MSWLGRIRTSSVAALTTSAIALAVSGCALFGTTAPAAASSNQIAMFEEPTIELTTSAPGLIASSLKIMRGLGVSVVRVGMNWNAYAPGANSTTRPAGFDATNSNDYPAGVWTSLDALVADARAYGIGVDLLVSGGAPLWAVQPGAPPYGPTGGSGPPFSYTDTFKPSGTDYGQFVHAVATRYPSVHFWEFWDEGNWGPEITPQYLNSSVPVSAGIYRAILDAGWSALQKTGHGHDTIVDGSLSQDGSAHVGETGTTAPLTFLRTLYCLSSSYHELRGAAASAAACPSSKAAYKHFRSAHPELFNATGIGDHPYPYSKAPPKVQFPDPNGAEFAELPHMVTALDRSVKAYGSHKHQVVYNTEYGYQNMYTTPTTQAEYINWAEYLSWKNPRIGSFDQYELYDPPPMGFFKTGLIYSTGQPKLSFSAYRLPIWLPVTSTKHGKTLEVWGDVRPAYFARADGHGAQYVSIQFSTGGAFTTIKRVKITNRYGYFDVRLKFPSSGQVRLEWSYPAGDPNLFNAVDPAQTAITSRVTGITIH